MRTIERVKRIHCSALGISCASILGAIEAKKAQRALSVASERHINQLE